MGGADTWDTWDTWDTFPCTAVGGQRKRAARALRLVAVAVLEADLRGRQVAEPRSRGVVLAEVAQQPMADPVARHSPELLLDRLDRRPVAGLGWQVEQRREAGRELTDRARQVGPGRHVGAQVARQLDQQRALARRPRERLGQRGQQQVVRAGAVRRRGAPERLALVAVEPAR